jgi:uncharacterized protein YheU (UPF0270 family)
VIEVPCISLQPATLRAVVEEFVTRATTDYDERERTLEEKVAHPLIPAIRPPRETPTARPVA